MDTSKQFNARTHEYLALRALQQITFLPATASAYVESTAKYYMDFSAAAYCAGTAAKRVENWNCPTCASHPGVNATTVYDRKTNTHGFVAYVPESNQVR